MKQTEEEEALQRRFSPEFLHDMIREFESETGNDLYIPVKNVLDRIGYLLDCYGITYSRYGDGKKDAMCKCPKLSSRNISIRGVVTGRVRPRSSLFGLKRSCLNGRTVRNI